MQSLGHTSLFGIVGFHAANVGGFFGHQDFHEFGEAVFELSCCLREKKENYTWRDDLELATNQQNTSWGVCIQIMLEFMFEKGEWPQPPPALELSPFQVSFCLSALSYQSTGLWWGSPSCTWSAERDVFRDEVQRTTRETWGQNYLKEQNEHWGLNQSFQSAALWTHSLQVQSRRILSLRYHLILNPTPHSVLETPLSTLTSFRFRKRRSLFLSRKPGRKTNHSGCSTGASRQGFEIWN